MVALSKSLNSSSVPWDIEKEPNPCSWKGVDCNSTNSSVVGVLLSGFSLSSPNFLPIVCKIDSLQMLNVSNNKLESIPEEFIRDCGKIDVLKLLDFSKNRLNLIFNNFIGSLPTQLGKSKLLEELQLSMNKFQGRIPEEIFGYPNLKLIDLSQNDLSGSPKSLSKITTLSRFAANQNEFNGVVPSGITKFLKNLDLSYNMLNGSIPSDLLAPPNLQSVDLSFNRLEGSLPVNMSSSLIRLRLGNNKLSGMIPTSFARLQRLTYLELENNSFTEVIPPELGSCQSLALLNLAQNRLRGSLPVQLGNLRQLEVLKLQSNDLTGEIPIEITQLHKLSTLNVSLNSLNGSIPPSISTATSLKDLSQKSCGLAGLEVLDLSNNNFSVTHYPCIKKGTPVAVTVVLAVLAAVFSGLVVTILAILFSRRYYKVNDEQPQSTDDLPLPQVLEGNTVTANGIHKSNIDFTKAMEAVSDPSNIVLKTRFSTYYEAIMPSGLIYFVKKLNWSDKIFQLGSHDRFGNELEAFGKLSNSNGTLFDVLHKSSTSDMDWASRYSIAVGVAQGLACLHGCASGPIILLDLSSRNIFLKSLKEPQVGDIELCKVIDPSRSTGSLSTIAGSVGYIPPEYAYTMRVTTAGNVYSFGVVLLELLTGKPAVSEGTELAKWVLSNTVQHSKSDHILDIRISRTSPVIKSQMLAVLKIGLSCVSVSRTQGEDEERLEDACQCKVMTEDSP
ncbi:hypothetical protein FNV43_RR21089 [Rhamnella rubrinervis]|uniref:Protein kinase domain-containing protein n=1 Tax=Rhamnella rubrinervis TaxID=2594499 RepID=A0A8K0GR39_9ROSA|nr:hypothetical protein FNV43_RR21089 [Rhamnella rubrinervis]